MSAPTSSPELTSSPALWEVLEKKTPEELVFYFQSVISSLLKIADGLDQPFIFPDQYWVPDFIAVFQKNKAFQKELAEAFPEWKFSVFERCVGELAMSVAKSTTR